MLFSPAMKHGQPGNPLSKWAFKWDDHRCHRCAMLRLWTDLPIAVHFDAKRILELGTKRPGVMAWMAWMARLWLWTMSLVRHLKMWYTKRLT